MMDARKFVSLIFFVARCSFIALLQFFVVASRLKQGDASRTKGTFRFTLLF
jgi:hypothetical protein